jgi:hypothetical protein
MRYSANDPFSRTQHGPRKSRYEVDMLPAFEGQEARQLLRSIGVEQARPVFIVAAPLSMNPNVVGGSRSAPNREPCRAVRERAGIHIRLRVAPGFDGPDQHRIMDPLCVRSVGDSLTR